MKSFFPRNSLDKKTVIGFLRKISSEMQWKSTSCQRAGWALVAIAIPSIPIAAHDGTLGIVLTVVVLFSAVGCFAHACLLKRMSDNIENFLDGTEM
jgi:hypothetical protein